jgi:hypothetical protein
MTYLRHCPTGGEQCEYGAASLSGHDWHCPACDHHLTSLYLCPACGVRYTPPLVVDLTVLEKLRLSSAQQLTMLELKALTELDIDQLSDSLRRLKIQGKVKKLLEMGRAAVYRLAERGNEQIILYQHRRKR